MILAQSDQFEICKEAFDYQIQCIDRDNARLVTDDGLVMTSLDSLLLYSTLLADIVSSSSLEYVTIIIPGVEKALVTRLLDILTNGVTTLSLNEDILELGDLIGGITELGAMMAIKIGELVFDNMFSFDEFVDPVESPSLDLSDEDAEVINNNKRVRKKIFKKNYQYRLNCNLCNANFYAEFKLVAHMNSVHKLGKFSCSKCQNTFSSTANLQRHQRQVKCRKLIKETKIAKKKRKVVKKKKSSIVCNICGNSYSSPTNLRRHVETVHHDFKYPCPVYDREYGGKSALNTHVRTHSRDQRNGTQNGHDN